MTDTPPPDPENTLSRNDPGDETARRYRYQWTWAAIVCCMLLDETEDVVGVFCEHHEDVLINHRDDTFTGDQVKTRASSDQDPWKSNDEGFLTSCARFVKLDTEFPGRFRAFRFLTNHPLHVANNAQSPEYLLAQIAEGSTIDDLPSPVASQLRKIADLAGCTPEEAFQALSKTRVRDDLPKLRDAMVRLVDTITSCWPAAADCSYTAAMSAAQGLVEECCRASSLDHEGVLPGYLSAMADPAAAEMASRIEGKRMTQARVLQVLERWSEPTASLGGDPSAFVEPGEGSDQLMLAKLDAGGMSAPSRHSAEDLRDKAEYLGITWTKKHGPEKGLDRYNHIRSLVLNDAARAYEAAVTPNHQFGPAMREGLRVRFAARREQGDELYECSDEHLEGVAYSLTAQCKVTWSIDRPWEDS